MSLEPRRIADYDAARRNAAPRRSSLRSNRIAERRVLAACMTIAIGLTSQVMSAAEQLLDDVDFAAGFAPNADYCTEWSVDSRFRLGDCLRYGEVTSEEQKDQQLASAVPPAIPDDGLGNRNKAWEFIEGEHRGLRCLPPAPFETCEPQGYALPDRTLLQAGATLHRHRIVFHHALVEAPDSRHIVSLGAQGRSVRAFSTNLRGVARFLTTMGVPTKTRRKKWNGGCVRGIYRRVRPAEARS